MRQSLLRRGLSLVAASTLGVMIAAHGTPLALAQGAPDLSVSIARQDTAQRQGQELTADIRVANNDAFADSSAVVLVRVGRVMTDWRVEAPAGWVCGERHYLGPDIAVLCSTASLGPGQTADVRWIARITPVTRGFTVAAHVQSGAGEIVSGDELNIVNNDDASPFAFNSSVVIESESFWESLPRNVGPPSAPPSGRCPPGGCP